MLTPPPEKPSSKTPCAVHATHHPVATYSELHHVIPQAWQKLYNPRGWPTIPSDVSAQRVLLAEPALQDAFPHACLSPDRPGLVLWDGREIPVCRTGHGNIHYYLVRIMHYMNDLPGDPLKLQTEHALTELIRATAHADKLAVGWSMQAITRFTDAGGDVGVLWAADEWGEI